MYGLLKWPSGNNFSSISSLGFILCRERGYKFPALDQLLNLHMHHNPLHTGFQSGTYSYGVCSCNVMEIDWQASSWALSYSEANILTSQGKDKHGAMCRCSNRVMHLQYTFVRDTQVCLCLPTLTTSVYFQSVLWNKSTLRYYIGPGDLWCNTLSWKEWFSLPGHMSVKFSESASL